VESDINATCLKDVWLRIVCLGLRGDILLPITFIFFKGVLHKALFSCNFGRQLERKMVTDTETKKKTDSSLGNIHVVI
jgi:hypothetical protein